MNQNLKSQQTLLTVITLNTKEKSSSYSQKTMDIFYFIPAPLILALVFIVLAIVFAYKGIKVVPQQSAWVVERLGKFKTVLNPGLNFIIPFIDNVAYRHSLKEIPLDTPAQVCITRDNTQLSVDGVLFFQVTDPMRASYGTSNYVIAITQLAQTTLRSVIGRMELDKTFEERDVINSEVVSAIDDAALNWGVKVLRYEIKDLTPPAVILQAMQQQITAEREKRALIAESEGRKQEQINLATGEKQAAIARSEGEKQAEINKAEGQAAATLAIATATAEALRKVADATQAQGGMTAVNLQVAEKYITAFNELARTNNTLIVPANMGDMSTLISSAMKIVSANQQPPVKQYQAPRHTKIQLITYNSQAQAPLVILDSSLELGFFISALQPD